jgi:hypothetical protein
MATMAMTMNVVDIFGKLKGMPGLLGDIFEYDDTYKCVFKQEILPNLWHESWKSWYYRIECPYEHAVAGYLTENWGVWDESPNRDMSRWFRDNYFPDGLSFIKHVDEKTGRMMVTAKMSYKDKRQYTVFRGMVLTQKQYTEECGEETPNDIRYLDIYKDLDHDLTVYISLF